MKKSCMKSNSNKKVLLWCVSKLFCLGEATNIQVPMGEDFMRATVLIRACYYGYDVLVATLLASKADVNMLYRKRTALHVACRKGHDKVVSLCLQAGADINLPWETKGYQTKN